MIRMIIAGTRDFNDYSLLKEKVVEFFTGKGYRRGEIEIISGNARGADKLGEKFAEEYNLKCVKFPADWDKFGKSAGYKRNALMAQYASEAKDSVLFAFWDGNSKGTKHMIDLGEEYKLDVNVVLYEKDLGNFGNEEVMEK